MALPLGETSRVDGFNSATAVTPWMTARVLKGNTRTSYIADFERVVSRRRSFACLQRFHLLKSLSHSPLRYARGKR